MNYPSRTISAEQSMCDEIHMFPLFFYEFTVLKFILALISVIVNNIVA